MDFDLSDDQRLLQDSLARLLADHYDFEARREAIASPDGWSRTLWRRFADMGLLALPGERVRAQQPLAWVRVVS